MGVIRLEDLKQKEVWKGYNARFVHTDNVTTGYWQVDAGWEFPLHSHPHEQISYVIKGRFEFNLDGDVTIIEPGAEAVVVPSNALHSGKALTDCALVDVFHPVREDYIF